MAWSAPLSVLAAALRRYPGRGKNVLWKHAARMFDGRTVTITLPGGGVMHIDTSYYWQRQMLAGCFERRSVWTVRRLLAPGDVFVDGGANCGLYSCLAAGVVGPSGRVHAFEPDPALAPQLTIQRDLNVPRIELHLAALSDADGHAMLHRPPADVPDGWGLGVATIESHPGWQVTSVPTQSLDTWMTASGVARVALAKLDLEGHEAAALRGAHRSLESGALESLLVEVNDPRVAQELAKYRFREVIDVRNGFRPIARLEALGGEHTDILCLRGVCFDRWLRIRRQTRWL